MNAISELTKQGDKTNLKPSTPRHLIDISSHHSFLIRVLFSRFVMVIFLLLIDHRFCHLHGLLLAGSLACTFHPVTLYLGKIGLTQSQSSPNQKRYMNIEDAFLIAMRTFY